MAKQSEKATRPITGDPLPPRGGSDSDSCHTGQARNSTTDRGSANDYQGPTGHLADAAGSNNDTADQRITCTSWPEDRDERLQEMTKIMPRAITDYFGNSVVIAHALSVTPKDVRDCIQADEGLKELQEVCENGVEALLTDRLIHLSQKSNSPVAAKFLLEKMFPDRWAKKPAEKSGGSFSAPRDKTLKSVIEN